MMITTKASIAVAFLFVVVNMSGVESPVIPIQITKSDAKVALSGVVASLESNALLVTAATYERNLIIVEDKGDRAEISRTEQVNGYMRTIPRYHRTVYLSADGKRFGALGHNTRMGGHALYTFNDPQQEREIFPVFGKMDRGEFDFGIVDDGSTVVVPGVFGVVCWSRRGDEWKEAWAVDFWKRNPEADWPFEDNRKQVPSFDAFIPRGADYVLVTFNCSGKDDTFRKTENSHGRYLSALNLKDGKERWRCEIPIGKTTTFAQLIASPDGTHVVLKVESGVWQNSELDFYRLDGEKLTDRWNFKKYPREIMVADKTGLIAILANHIIEVRRADGSIVWQSQAHAQEITGMAFGEDGKSLHFVDESGHLSRVGDAGKIIWTVPAFGDQSLTVKGNRIYGAGRDGFLTCFDVDGKKIWTLDCNTLWIPRNLQTNGSDRNNGTNLIQASRPQTTSRRVPAGENQLRNGNATLALGLISGGEMKRDTQFNVALLTNGQFDDVTRSWLEGEDRYAGQACAEIEFKKSTDVHSLTAYENSTSPDSWPTEAFVQVWDEAEKKWSTVARGLFLVGPTNTYTLNLKNVKKMRYIPWKRSTDRILTSEIEVR